MGCNLCTWGVASFTHVGAHPRPKTSLFLYIQLSSNVTNQNQVTRQHLEDRVRALTDQLAPPLPGAAVGTSSRGSNPLNNPQEAPPRPPPPQLNGAPPGYDAPPSYNEAQATMGAHGEVKKMWKENENYLLPQGMILGARENNGEQAWNQAMQGEVAEVLLTMEGVQVELFLL